MLDAARARSTKPDAKVDHETLTRSLVALARLDGMHAREWLEMQAVSSTMPRRKPPAAVDLVARLVGVEPRRLVIEDVGDGLVRCTIANHRGDVASVTSGRLANAIDGAIRLADARKDHDP